VSIAVMSRVWSAGPKKHVDRYVLLAIADNANSDGFAYPSIRHLASKTRLSERTVMRSIQALEQDGWLAREKRSRDAKYSTYTIILDRLTDDSESRDSVQGQVTLTSDEVTGKAGSSDCGDIPPHPLLGRTVNKPSFNKPSENHQALPNEEASSSRDPEERPTLVRQIVCAHPKSRLRSLQPREVRHAQEVAVLEAMAAEIHATGQTDIEVLQMMLSCTELLAEKVPRSEWRFFRDVCEFFRSYDYRLEAEHFTKSTNLEKAGDHDSPARRRWKANQAALATAKRAVEQSLGIVASDDSSVSLADD
jgi:hypothetical protein